MGSWPAAFLLFPARASRGRFAVTAPHYIPTRRAPEPHGVDPMEFLFFWLLFGFASDGHRIRKGSE
ncbi:MAG: hypothetical protein EA422_12195 [Gemmatimonadales bacterium]|nr:MAG: hypothetical protein EA422_12195 [Gemmatimonadales bacterium]